MAFRPFTTMSENIPEIGREYVLAVGAITLAWAHLELALDLIIGVEGHLSNSKKRMPISFKGKHDRLFTILKKSPPHIAPYKGELMQIMVLSEQASSQRHLATHGALFGTLSETEMKVARLVRNETDDDLEEGKVSFHEMFLIVQMIWETTLHAYNLLFRMVKAHVPEAKDMEFPTIDVSQFQWPAVHPRSKKPKPRKANASPPRSVRP